MSQYKVDFESMPWETPIAGLRYKAERRGGRQLRVVEYTREMEPHWCDKGHIGCVLTGAFNAVHFFLPIDKLVSPTICCSTIRHEGGDALFIFGGDVSEMGLFRPNRPAIGRAGFHSLSAGRRPLFNLCWLSTFKQDDLINDLIRPDGDIQEDQFLSLCYPLAQEDLLNVRQDLIYSMDASRVLIGVRPGVGAHREIQEWRNFEETFTFILNFTRVLGTCDGPDCEDPLIAAPGAE